ncbi:glycosyltransferase [Polynucleobacter sp. es-MAR-4]|uniref:glycosyltransferase n=1 Tax=Polynucleobacter sp. es-MAR-4 TaxID=1855655 RepID=UPI001C0B20A7|nr:glycosyltransferase [Polynucleobacter sp. es-MAR-4]MBU3637563.1 glycosyltransferase [Polynucleobacter sp. es-MAR-4]
MKILQVISTLNPAFGGPVEGLKQMVQAIAEEGHEVSVLTLDDPGETWFEGFPASVIAVGPSYFKYGLNFKLISWLKNNAKLFDVVIVNGIWQFHSYAVCRALKGTATPYFVYTHGMLDPWFRLAYPIKHLKKWLYWPWAEYVVLKNARAVLFTSEEERLLARSSFWLYRCNEMVVNFGIKGFVSDSSEHINFFYKSYPHLQDKRVILYLGRLHLKKGCDLLIDAFSKIVLADKNLHLVFIGNDQDGWRSKLESKVEQLGINSYVSWLGMVDEQLKWGALLAADVFILPSHSENFGASVVEALSCSTPVLISNKVNIWREIKNSEAGFVESDDLEGTGRLLNKWLSLKNNEKDEMIKRSKECFTKNFEITLAVKNLINAIAK